MIGIIAAMKAEHQLICQKIESKQTKTIAGIDFVYGKISKINYKQAQTIYLL